MRRIRLFVPAAIAIVTAASVQFTSSASASPSPTRHASAVTTAGSAPVHRSTSTTSATRPTPVTGYTIVRSDAIADPANSQTYGSVSCPRGTSVVGGGAAIAGKSLSENINGSTPRSQRTWGVFVNNSSSSAGSFTVDAECAKGIANYSIVTGTTQSNPSGSQSQAIATCPTDTVTLGGGGVGASGSPLQNLQSSYSYYDGGSGWVVEVGNASASDSAATAIAVCGKKPAGYQEVQSSSLPINANSQGGPAVANCPSGKVILSGGVETFSSSVQVNLNTTYPNSSTAWWGYENNATAVSNAIVTTAFCATPAAS